MNRYFFIVLMLMPLMAWAQISVKDGSGHIVTLPTEAHKIISLSPHATELLYSAGAGSRIIAVSNESDYPEPVKNLPKVGSYHQISLESILSHQPDLVIAWQDGGQQQLIQQLQQMGIAVFISNPLTPQDISDEIHALGTLVGMPNIADQNTAPYRYYVHQLSEQIHTPPVRSIFLVGDHPIYAVSNHSFLGKMLQICGSDNIYADIPTPALTLNQEALIKQTVDIIFTSKDTPPSQWLSLYANTKHPPKIIAIDADLRPSLRIKSSLEQMCLIIESKRLMRH